MPQVDPALTAQQWASMTTSLTVGGKSYRLASLPALGEAFGVDLARMPFCLKTLAENVLRRALLAPAERTAASRALTHLCGGAHAPAGSKGEIAFYPARVLMQDFTGVPAMVDLAAMRDALRDAGKDPARINPSIPVDLVIDHSVMVDTYGTSDAWAQNTAMEYQRNHERYAFLRWCQENFKNFRVIPPESGICHQVNLEYLAQVVSSREQKDGALWAYPDTMVGTDSHTTMIGGLAVLGWGVGGIEAEAAVLGGPIAMLIPEVFGVRVKGRLNAGVTATDLVLTVTQQLRARGVVEKFVEFYGEGLDHLPLADRATIGNMAPEYGATCGFFPIDQETLHYLAFTGRAPHQVALVEAYAKAQGLWRRSGDEPIYSETMELDLSQIEPSLAGPKRPQDRLTLAAVGSSFLNLLPTPPPLDAKALATSSRPLTHGDVVIAAITSCTNTSNPSVMVAAGLVARAARARGLAPRPWVKTSLSPGSMVVSAYLAAAGLDKDLDALGFHLTGYGCSTCIGNSGPLAPEIQEAVNRGQLVVAAVLSGNRNFEGRIHPLAQANYLASPPLVVAYALAGNVRIDLTRQPLGEDPFGNKVYLKDIWPKEEQIEGILRTCLSPQMFIEKYASIDHGDAAWRALLTDKSSFYHWDANSTYIKRPPFFTDPPHEKKKDLSGARLLALLGDSVTTDHISPAGNIKKTSPAGLYLARHGVAEADFNSYGSRRGNHEVMVRGTFANIRLSNALTPGIKGGFTRIAQESGGGPLPIYDAAMAYQARDIPLIIIAGREYGAGSSRDWAAKGTALLGVHAVIAESFERIHRSNLVGMGVIPLEFHDPRVPSWRELHLTGDETFALIGLAGTPPGGRVVLRIDRADHNGPDEVVLRCRIDTLNEMEMLHKGGLLQQALQRFLQESV